jgi:hypothetical protein
LEQREAEQFQRRGAVDVLKQTLCHGFHGDRREPEVVLVDQLVFE